MQISLADAPKYEALEHSGNQGLYSAVQPDTDTVSWLSDLCNRLGFTDVKPGKFHCTIMYSPDKTPAPNDVELDGLDYPAVAREVTYWDGHDDLCHVILKLVSTKLHGEHQRLKQMGCVPTYDEYVPHITLQSDVDMTPELELQIAKVNAELKRNAQRMILNRQIVGDIDP